MKKGSIIWIVLMISGQMMAQTSPLFAKMLRAGNTAYESGKYLQAELEYRKALDLQPDRPEALFNLGATLFQQGRYDQSVQALERSLKVETDPIQQSRIQYNLGTSLMAKEDFEAAAMAFRSALRLDASLEEARHNLGIALKQIEEHSQSEDNNDEEQTSEQQEEQQDQETEESSDESPENTPPSDQPPAKPMTPEEADQMLRRLEFQEQQVQKQIRERQQRNRIRNEKDW